VSENFGVVVVADFEFEISGGDYNLRSGDMPMHRRSTLAPMFCLLPTVRKPN
jgi:hypothetical protein